MKTTSTTWLLLIAILTLFSCKTSKSPEHHYVDYKPYFDQTQKVYVQTPSFKEAKLDTLVQVLSNLREEVYNFKDSFPVVQEFNIYQGELAIDINLINEKPPVFDTFMVVRDFQMKDTLVNSLFPVIPDSFKTALLSLNDSSAIAHLNDSAAIQLTLNDTTVIPKKLLPPDSLKTNPIIAERKYYTRREILSDTTRDLFDADTVISGVFASTGLAVGDSIRYYKGFSDYFQDSSIRITTDMVYVEIHDPSREVKQYPVAKLSKQVVEKKMVPDKIIYSNQVVFKVFHKDEEDVFMKMVRVQGGTFKMGSNEFDEDERPEYGLNVPNFLIGKYEVTNQIFCIFLNVLRCDSQGYVNHTKFIDWKSRYSKIFWDYNTGRYKVYAGYEEFPVVNITWAAANKVCKEMGGQLPTEARWEYAAKGGIYAIRYYTNVDHTDYAYEHRFAGSNMMNDVGWFVDNSEGSCQMVGALTSNRLGIYDMCGNVWEWCYDNYNKDFYKRNSDSSDPTCLISNGVRVNRGGSWSSDAMYCRITNRNFSEEFQTNPTLGFRLMREWTK